MLYDFPYLELADVALVRRGEYRTGEMRSKSMSKLCQPAFCA